MKINWGTGLAITLGIFAFGMGFTVYQATQSEHDLVTRDYYQQELAYQSTIDGKTKYSSCIGINCSTETLCGIRISCSTSS